MSVSLADIAERMHQREEEEKAKLFDPATPLTEELATKLFYSFTPLQRRIVHDVARYGYLDPEGTIRPEMFKRSCKFLVEKGVLVADPTHCGRYIYAERINVYNKSLKEE